MGTDVNPATGAPPSSDLGTSAPSFGPRFWGKYGREIILIVLSIIAALIAAYLIYHFLLTKPDTRDDPNSNLVDMIYLDASWFHKLYVRWSITDWSLTFLAAGTAVSAAIKNTYASKTDANVSLSSIDILLIVLAVMTVLATTFDGKLHAGQLAEKYRAGDLHLQTAKFIYAASNKDAEAKAKLLASWREAQEILESSSLTPNKPTAAAPPPNNTGNQSTQQTQPAGTTDTTTKGSAAPPARPH
jgi:hypothetical protein